MGRRDLTRHFKIGVPDGFSRMLQIHIVILINLQEKKSVPAHK